MLHASRGRTRLGMFIRDQGAGAWGRLDTHATAIDRNMSVFVDFEIDLDWKEYGFSRGTFPSSNRTDKTSYT